MSCHAQLANHKPLTKDSADALKARLADLAHMYCDMPTDISDFHMQRECLIAARGLRTNSDIHISKPDKGTGVVILNRSDYTTKMHNILDDATKFRKLGDAPEHDRTALLERKLTRRLLELHKSGELSDAIYDRIRPVGSQRPRMYGLPKTHKSGVPLRPILSMTNSAQHELAKWLTELLQPALCEVSDFTIKDSFTFADAMREYTVDCDNVTMCSFDIVSLFTNVPLTEAIDICALLLFHGGCEPPSLSESVFRELMLWATRNVEFSFDDVMYAQIDGVAMGSPLGPILANIFVGYHEKRAFADVSPTRSPLLYYRYVDDTFALFQNRAACENFLTHLNALHPSLKYTIEIESDGTLPFLDVLVEKSAKGFVTSVYRKPTFTGQYTRWDSFSPTRYKTGLIGILVDRAQRICSPCKLAAEINRIKDILRENGYPDRVIDYHVSRKLHGHTATPAFGPKRCPIYLKLPWRGKASQKFEKQIKQAVSGAFPSVEARVVFTTHRMISSVRKDVLPITQCSNVIYEFKCRCEARYVGRTSQRLADRMSQHVPASIRNRNTSARTQPSRTCRKPTVRTATDGGNSAIAHHLMNNQECAEQYCSSWFKVLSRARSFMHLRMLEAVYIQLNDPILCRQKEFVRTLALF